MLQKYQQTHINIMKSCKSGLKEYEVEADFIKHCMSERCEQAYPAIVASGKNACVLHYTKNNSILRSNSLCLWTQQLSMIIMHLI